MRIAMLKYLQVGVQVFAGCRLCGKGWTGKCTWMRIRQLLLLLLLVVVVLLLHSFGACCSL